GIGADRVERGQFCKVEFLRRLPFRLARGRGNGFVGFHFSDCRVVGYGRLVGLRVFAGDVALATRPASEKFFLITHLPSSRRDGPWRHKGSGLARSRLRFTKLCSTWCSAMKAEIASCIGSGIGTASTRLTPASVIASPSAGSAVTIMSSNGGSR